MKATSTIFEGEWGNGAEPVSTVLTDTSRYRNNGSMVASQPDWIQTSKGLWVNSYNGTNAVIDVGNIGLLMMSAIFWIYPDDNTTRSFADFDGGTHSLELDGAGDCTAIGWAAPTIYINGSDADPAVAQDVWSCIIVTTATAFTVSDFDIGREAAAYFDGYIAPPILLSYPLNAAQVRSYFGSTRWWFNV